MKRRWLVGVFLVALLAHGETVSYWFGATDSLLLIQSSRIHSVSDFIDIFTRPLMAGTGFTDIALLYRPISSLSYAIDYWVWGLDPTGYHLTNLLLHGIATVLVAITINELTDRPTVGVLCAALFALHPLMADIVPAISRRQDVLMTIFLLGALTLFVRSHRQPKGHMMLGASLAAYVLAVGAKEPALIFPGLVFAWVLFHQEQYADLGAFRTSLWAVLPFGVVTAVYLAVRIAVLGALGGYQLDISISIRDRLASVTEYILSIAYPSDVIGTGAHAVNGWTILLVGLVLLAVFVLACGLCSLDRSGPELLLFAGFVCGLGLVPLILVFGPSLERELLALFGYLRPTRRHPYVYPRPITGLLGVTFVGTCSVGLGWATLARTPSLSESDRRALLMFLVWLLLPLAVFLWSGVYTLWNGYLSSIPALAILSLLLVTGGRTLRQHDTTELPNGNTALVALVLLLILPLIATSPLFHPYNGWEATGEVNRVTLTAIDHELEDSPSDVTVAVGDLPRGLKAQERAFPRVKSIIYLSPDAIETWLELQYPNRDVQVVPARTGSSHLQRTPVQVSINTTNKQGTLILRLHYETIASEKQPVLLPHLDYYQPITNNYIARNYDAPWRSRYRPNTTTPMAAPYHSVPSRMMSVAPAATERGRPASTSAPTMLASAAPNPPGRKLNAPTTEPNPKTNRPSTGSAAALNSESTTQRAIPSSPQAARLRSIAIPSGRGRNSAYAPS
jgi:hypothetical protein